jgi:hypothetical protein
MKKISAVCMMLLLTAAPAAFGASPLETGNDETLTGRVDYVDPKRESVVVDDMKYVISPNLRVTTSSGGSLSLDSLRNGMKVGFLAVPVGNSDRSQIVKIWLLPN